jgi:hypothetical protein
MYNDIITPILSTLPEEVLTAGLNGAHLPTYYEATAADSAAFYSSSLGRALTVKESIDVLISEISRIENEIGSIDEAAVYDDSALVSAVNTLEQDITQLTEDIMGANYTLDGDGSPNLSYPLSQIVDALGAFFAGYTPTGNTYSGSYPAISFSGGTLQGAYTAGTTGAGDVELENAKGHIVIKDDPITPIEVYLEWQDDGAVSLGEIGADGIYLKTDAGAYKLTKTAAAPAAAANTGAIIVMDDAVTSDAELHYRNDEAADDPAQITRAGRVKELEMGSEWVTPVAMIQTSAPPTRNNIVLGVAPNTDMEYAAVQLPDAANTLLYVTTSMPVDEDGLNPGSAFIQVFSAPTTNPGAGPYTYELVLHANDTGTSPIVAAGGTLIPTVWSSLGISASPAIAMPANLNRLDEHHWTLPLSDMAGVLPLKIERNTASGGDTYVGTVSIIGMKITWYR